MKHALASVALLALVMGCDSGGTSDEPDTNSAVTTTGGTGMPTVSGPTGNSVSMASSNAATTTGGQFGAGGASGGTDGEGGSAGDGEYGVAGEAGAPNYPEDPYPALAMTMAQRQALLNGNSGAVSTTGSAQDDTDDLWVVISDTAMVCTEFPPFPECGGHWKVDFVLPRSMQQVGTYEPEWFGYSYSTEAEDPSLPDICGGGGGSGSIEGHIVEVLAIDENEIRFRIHSDPLFIDDEVNGIYTVPLCP